MHSNLTAECNSKAGEEEEVLVLRSCSETTVTMSCVLSCCACHDHLLRSACLGHVLYTVTLDDLVQKQDQRSMLRAPTAVVIPVSFSEAQLSSGDAQPLRTFQSVRLLSRTPGSVAKRAGRRSSCTAQFARQQGSRSSGSGVQDAQQTELAAADQQDKQDLYAQLLDRRHSSQLSEVSASNSVGSGTSQTAKAESGSTELIFRLERRGEGWGEEIFPHLVVEQRPWTSAAKRDRNRSSRPKPWTVLP